MTTKLLIAALFAAIFALAYATPSLGADDLSPILLGPGAPPAGAAQGLKTGADLFARFTEKQIKAQGQKTSKYVSFDRSCDGKSNSPVVRAGRAAVQIIHKSLIYPADNGFKIYNSHPTWCAGHPLNDGVSGIPVAPAPPANASSDRPSARSLADIQKVKTPRGVDIDALQEPCSGFLVGDAHTVGSVAHCFHGLSEAQICEQYVFVFGRQCGNENFSAEQVRECGGAGLQALERMKDASGKSINLHTDTNAKDHAFLRLKADVPKTIAEPLKFRDHPLKTGAAETYFAIGYPGGTHRSISPLTARSTVTTPGGAYCYTNFTGVIYRGNPGGPIVDAEGRLVGIVGSDDDSTAAGDHAKREPLAQYQDAKGKNQTCETQVAGPVTTQGLGICKDIATAQTLASRLPATTTAPPASRSGADSFAPAVR